MDGPLAALAASKPGLLQGRTDRRMTVHGPENPVEKPGGLRRTHRVLLVALGLFGALALEGAALALVGAAAPDRRPSPLALPLHGAAVLLHSLLCYRLLPSGLRTSPWKSLVFLFSLGLFLPGIGLVGPLGLLGLLHRRRRQHRVHLRLVPIPDLPRAPFRVSAQPIYIAVGLMGVIRHSSHIPLRLQAVMATRQMPDRLAIPILSVALKDQSDDVRLLAYSMLDGKERQIDERIKALEHRLDEKPSASRLPDLWRRLAQEHWELVYLGLVQGQLQQHALAEARRLLGQALDQRPDDSGAWLLLGRIHLRAGDALAALQALDRSLQAGMSIQAVAPYQAEAAFHLRRWAEVRHFLSQIPQDAARRSPLAELARFWLPRGTVTAYPDQAP